MLQTIQYKELENHIQNVYYVCLYWHTITAEYTHKWYCYNMCNKMR